MMKTTDGLGRTIKTIERNGSNQADRYTTESTYDIRGNLLTIKDALKRTAFSYIYDLTPASEEGEDEQGAQVLRIEQLDAGVRRIVFDATGNEIERRDSKGALILQAHDDLDRPVRLWARDNSDEGMTLREHLIYGDSAESGLTQNQVEAANLCGELYRHYDEAGRLTFEVYDFKGNLMEKSRQVISDAAILAVFNPPPPNWEVKPFRVDWQPPAGITLNTHADGLLDASVYQTSLTYDAMNRIKTMRYPQDVDGGRKALTPKYNRAGALEQVKLDGAAYVKHIAHNAKGQRTLIAYGNGLMTRYTYEPKTFRLNRMRTERHTMPNGLTYHPMGQALQDFGYEYDLAGNILEITDRTPGSGISNTVSGTNVLDRAFTYDPLYRLLSATGRECDTSIGVKPWDDTPKCQDVSLTRGYKEVYRYDAVGNMTQLDHTAGSGGFVRDFTLVPGTNRLQSMAVGGSSYAYKYDVNGNMVRENRSRHFEWDHSDRMRAFRNQVSGSEPSVHVQYLYDADGQRMKKLVRKQNGRIIEVTVYIDEIFEHRRQVKGGVTKANSTLHVMDDESRIAMKRVGSALDTNDNSPAVQYQFGDHLGNCNVVVNADGTWINREEFTPYGETSFGRYAAKRYRFTGKERDEESGLNYHGARYYASWLGKWVSCDPPLTIGSGKTLDMAQTKRSSRQPVQSSDLNVYLAFNNQPNRYVDIDGANAEEKLLARFWRWLLKPKWSNILSRIPSLAAGTPENVPATEPKPPPAIEQKAKQPKGSSSGGSEPPKPKRYRRIGEARRKRLARQRRRLSRGCGRSNQASNRLPPKPGSPTSQTSQGGFARVGSFGMAIVLHEIVKGTQYLLDVGLNKSHPERVERYFISIWQFDTKAHLENLDKEIMNRTAKHLGFRSSEDMAHHTLPSAQRHHNYEAPRR
jgi:RHS repeat-associated protein